MAKFYEERKKTKQLQREQEQREEEDRVLEEAAEVQERLKKQSSNHITRTSRSRSRGRGLRAATTRGVARNGGSRDKYYADSLSADPSMDFYHDRQQNHTDRSHLDRAARPASGWDRRH